jgi:iron complex outermembrane receptor protein
VAGRLYYFHEKYEIDASATTRLAGACRPRCRREQRTTRGRVRLDPVRGAAALKLRAGLRYTHDKKDLATTPDASTVTTEGVSRSLSDSKVNWDASGTYA